MGKHYHMYPTDLTDSQWEVIKNCFDHQRKRKYPLRRILDAIFYITKSGVQWALLPKDFPPKEIVYYYFSRWRDSGHWKEVNVRLVRMHRKKHKRKPAPSTGIADSQSVENREWGVPEKGFDGHKKVKGRKRHIVIDTLGLILCCVVSPANRHDSKVFGALATELKRCGFKRMRRIIADGAYSNLTDWLKNNFRWELVISLLSELRKGFTPIQQRWKVERTISWLKWNRRLSSDYELHTQTSEAFVLIANIRHILKNY